MTVATVSRVEALQGQAHSLSLKNRGQRMQKALIWRPVKQGRETFTVGSLSASQSKVCSSNPDVSGTAYFTLQGLL